MTPLWLLLWQQVKKPWANVRESVFVPPDAVLAGARARGIRVTQRITLGEVIDDEE